MSSENNVLVCGIGVIQDDRGRVLIAKRRNHDSFGGYWEFPGGKKRSQESFEDCVKREIEEELGLIVAVGDFLDTIYYEYADHPVSLHFYACRAVSGEPQCLIVEEFRWIDPKDYPQYQFLPASLPMLHRLAQDVG